MKKPKRNVEEYLRDCSLKTTVIKEPVIPVAVQEYVTENGKIPFRRFLGSIRDKRSLSRVLTFLARIRAGNMGDSKPVGGGVLESRMHFGPGYRIYFGRYGESIILLLAGGTKKTQQRDIELAKDYFADYRRRQP